MFSIFDFFGSMWLCADHYDSYVICADRSIMLLDSENNQALMAA